MTRWARWREITATPAADDSTIDPNRRRGECRSRMHDLGPRANADGDCDSGRGKQTAVESRATDHRFDTACREPSTAHAIAIDTPAG
jgi:hypothetical protein